MRRLNIILTVSLVGTLASGCHWEMGLGDFDIVGPGYSAGPVNLCNLSVSGHVTDASGNGMEGVVVFIHEGDDVAVTSADLTGPEGEYGVAGRVRHPPDSLFDFMAVAFQHGEETRSQELAKPYCVTHVVDFVWD